MTDYAINEALELSADADIVDDDILDSDLTDEAYYEGNKDFDIWCQERCKMIIEQKDGAGWDYKQLGKFLAKDILFLFQFQPTFSINDKLEKAIDYLNTALDISKKEFGNGSSLMRWEAKMNIAIRSAKDCLKDILSPPISSKRNKV